ncbi:MAG: hypothetical protein IH605_08605 [Burkholderiales bacterium]|nr:hypothetical protein [Burkholderiales bacterium]
MSKYVENPVHFAAECARQKGHCAVVRENILFLDDGKEHTAINYLQKKCGNVVIAPDADDKGRALLYYTSCERMGDVVSQIFQHCLEAPMSLPQPASEMTVGELYRRRVTVSYDDCRARVENFRF